MNQLETFRAEKDEFFRDHPHSPVAGAPSKFTGLSYFPEAAAYRLEAEVEPFAEAEEVDLLTSVGDMQRYLRFGLARFELEGRELSLTLFKPLGSDGHAAGLFVPFKDGTNGRETYGAGRYLETGPLVNERLLLDFNYAYNPFCAYSERYRCPLPPFENHLNADIRAGETKPESDEDSPEVGRPVAEAAS